MKPWILVPHLLSLCLFPAHAEKAKTRFKTVDFQAKAAALTGPKSLYITTPLFTNGKSESLLVGTGNGRYLESVRMLQNCLKEMTGQTLTEKRDTSVTEENYRQHHLIAIGNLSTNLVIRRMYARHYAFCDRVFPGKGKFIIRTIHDPFGHGRNVVLLGGSDRAGVRAATSEFIRILKQLKEPILPRLIVRESDQFDISTILQPRGEDEELERIFEEPEEGDGAQVRPRRKPTHPIVKLLSASDDRKAEIWRRLNEPAMHYLLHGDLASARKYKAGILALAEIDRGCTSRSARWFQNEHMIWQYWNQVEECGLFSDKERLLVDRFMIRMAYTCFNTVVADKGLIVALYDPKRTANNHWSGLWLAQAYYAMAYLHTYYPSDETAEKMRGLETFVAGLEGSFKPDEDATGYQEGFQKVKVELLMHAGMFDFFKNGNAARTGNLLIMPLTNLGTLASYGDASGPRPGYRQANTFLNVASLMLRDGQYTWAAQRHHADRGGIHAFANDIPIAVPKAHIGLNVQPLDPAFCKRWLKTAADLALADSGRGFDKITLRAGWGPKDDYILLQGIGYVGIHPHYDTNTIVRYQAKGQDWIVDDSYTQMALRDHSLVTIAREGRSSPLPKLARLDTAFDFEGGALVRTTLANWTGTDWTRNIFWLANQYLVVIDEVRAREDGTLLLRNIWQHTGKSRLEGSTLVSDQDRARFYLAAADAASASIHDGNEVLRGTGNRRIMEFWRLAGPELRAGQSYAFLSLLWAQKNNEPRRYHWLPISDLAAFLDDGKSQWVIGVGHGDESGRIGEFRITARAFWIAAERIVLTQATEFSVKNIPILKTPEPVTVELDLARGQARFAGPGTELQTPIAQFREQVRSSLAAMKRAAEAFASKRGAERKVLPAKFKWSVEFKPAPSRLSNIDLDQDGTDEILALSGKTITALDIKGRKLWTCQAPSKLRALPPVHTDMDGDGERDILVAASGCRFLVLSSDGKLKRQVSTGRQSPTAFTSGNLGVYGAAPSVDRGLVTDDEPEEDDGFDKRLESELKGKDRAKEIIFGYATDRFNGKLDAYDLNGTRGWSVTTKGFPGPYGSETWTETAKRRSSTP